MFIFLAVFFTIVLVGGYRLGFSSGYHCGRYARRARERELESLENPDALAWNEDEDVPCLHQPAGYRSDGP